MQDCTLHMIFNASRYYYLDQNNVAKRCGTIMGVYRVSEILTKKIPNFSWFSHKIQHK